MQKYNNERKKFRKVEYIETNYLDEEPIILPMDVYNIFIAANMTKNCTSLELNYCLKFCILTFIIQTALAYYYSIEYIGFDKFEPFDPVNSYLRLICALLLQGHV